MIVEMRQMDSIEDWGKHLSKFWGWMNHSRKTYCINS